MSINTPDTGPAPEPQAPQPPNRLIRRLAAGALVAAVSIGGAVEFAQQGDNEPQSQSQGINHQINPTHNPSSEQVAPTPEKSNPTPEQVMPTPEQITPTPEQVTPKPVQITPTPEHVAPTPEPTSSPTPTSTPTVETTASAMSLGQKAVEKLPGFGMRVTEQERAMLRASTVKIVDRPKGVENAAWFDVCSGLKVSVGGATYVATARHCFDKDIAVKKEFPSLATGADHAIAPDLHQTTNITDKLTHDIGVWTVGSDGVDVQDRNKTAPVSAVSVRYYPDFALLKIDQSAPESAAFNAIPAVPYDAGLAMTPTPGAEVAVFSLPDSNGGTIVKGSGYYLGRMADPGDPAREIDLVGINPATPSEDACNNGASGSVAAIAGGYLTGPLSVRNNISNPPGSNGQDGTPNDMNNRRAMEDKLNLDLSRFSTICGYSVTPAATARDVAHSIS